MSRYPSRPRSAATALHVKRFQRLALTAALGLAAAASLLPQPARAAGKADKPATAAAQPGNCPASLDFRFPRLQDEAPQNLCQYAGKVVLVVNTASYCGFTPQYEGLEQLYAKYRDRGLVVLGFPSNDFSQEPGSSKEISDFCYNTYGVKFPMLGKSHVRGSEANPMYTLLAKESGTAPKWNFYKYLIDRKGQVAGSFNSMVKPDDKQFVAKIEELLGAR
ncbi:glutathione peroxidase [Cupriavidus agavae]|uniref:Glutathione peroxidase n=1 Tax=Cupriavidus agavae TaxID=1001822 RepID=A0A4Q7RZ40_9BURK|nr:glutathione peroxidase [Cupriavidus agavae]RZT38478.1 glutathione peroxidase [Cupriavidus agavae]